MSYDPICRVCRAAPVMDRCTICAECYYAPRDKLGAVLDRIAEREGIGVADVLRHSAPLGNSREPQEDS